MALHCRVTRNCNRGERETDRAWPSERPRQTDRQTENLAKTGSPTYERVMGTEPE